MQELGFFFHYREHFTTLKFLSFQKEYCTWILIVGGKNTWWLKHLVLTERKALSEVSFWEEVMVYNTKNKEDDMQAEKCSMLLKFYFHLLFFPLQLIFVVVKRPKVFSRQLTTVSILQEKIFLLADFQPGLHFSSIEHPIDFPSSSSLSDALQSVPCCLFNMDDKSCDRTSSYFQFSLWNFVVVTQPEVQILVLLVFVLWCILPDACNYKSVRVTACTWTTNLGYEHMGVHVSSWYLVASVRAPGPLASCPQNAARSGYESWGGTQFPEPDIHKDL